MALLARETTPEKGTSENAISSQEPVWIFGYGSLLWKVNFPYQDKVVGYVKGYCRRFWQGSEDHRGVPGAAGRVATIIEEPQETTWGVAYLVDPNDIREVMAYLNHREKGGYMTIQLLFHPKEDLQKEPFHTLLYIGTEANPMYLGPAPIEDIARQVIRSRGPSGCNVEYVLNLAQALREIAPSVQDDHLFALESQINKLVKNCLKGGGDTNGCVDGDEQTLTITQDSQCTCKLCDLIDTTNL